MSPELDSQVMLMLQGQYLENRWMGNVDAGLTAVSLYHTIKWAILCVCVCVCVCVCACKRERDDLGKKALN